MILDLVISVVTIIQMYLLSRKAKSGLYVGIFSQFLWFAFIITTGSWGLFPLNIAGMKKLINFNRQKQANKATILR